MNKIILGILLIGLIFSLGCTSGEAGKLFSTTNNEANPIITENAQWKDTYTEGEKINGLQGKPVKLEVNQITQTGSSSITYQANLSLKYQTGELIDSQTVHNLDRLEQKFIDSKKDYALTTPIVIENIGVNPTTGIGFIKFALNKWYENQSIINLWGKNTYENQKLTVKIKSIVQAGTQPQDYRTTVEIYSLNGTILDSKTVKTGAKLHEEFTDSTGNLILSTPLQITEISIEPTNGIGYIKARIN